MISSSELCAVLNALLGEQKMENVEITVKVNGKEVPIDTISTETFEKVKEAAKEPEYEGVYLRKYCSGGNYDRVVFKVTDQICNHKGQVVLLDGDGDVMLYCPTFKPVCEHSCYSSLKKLGDK